MIAKTEDKHLRVMQETAYAEFDLHLKCCLHVSNQIKRACFGFFHHSKDEYNHTQVFLSLLSKYGKK